MLVILSLWSISMRANTHMSETWWRCSAMSGGSRMSVGSQCLHDRKAAAAIVGKARVGQLDKILREKVISFPQVFRHLWDERNSLGLHIHADVTTNYKHYNRQIRLICIANHNDHTKTWCYLFERPLFHSRVPDHLISTCILKNYGPGIFPDRHGRVLHIPPHVEMFRPH